MSYELKVRCEHCDRFIPLKAAKTSYIEVRCTERKCKKWNKLNIVMVSEMSNG